MSEPLTLSEADRVRRRRLRRAKTFATGLLVLAAVVFLLVRPYAATGATWAGYVLTASEAAMVGGLADWFAVTALFRRPLGLPIPHTALIPRRKDALGQSLGSFVGENFLAPDVVQRRLEQADVVGRVGAWLARPANAARLTAEAAGVLHGMLTVLDDQDVRALAEDAIAKRLRTTPLAPVLGRMLEQVVVDGSYRPLVDLVATRSAAWLQANPMTMISLIEAQAPEWSPSFVDRALARRIYKEALRIVTDASEDPAHPLRIILERYLRGLAHDLQHDEPTGEKLQALVRRLLAHQGTRDAVATVLAAGRQAVLELVDEPDGALRTRAAAAVEDLGEQLAGPSALRDKAERWLGQAAAHITGSYRDELPRLVTDTVDRWDGVEAARRIELVAGPDLQFIRVNGTVVGALAGVAIHSVALLLG